MIKKIRKCNHKFGKSWLPVGVVKVTSRRLSSPYTLCVAWQRMVAKMGRLLSLEHSPPMLLRVRFSLVIKSMVKSGTPIFSRVMTLKILFVVVMPFRRSQSAMGRGDISQRTFK